MPENQPSWRAGGPSQEQVLYDLMFAILILLTVAEEKGWRRNEHEVGCVIAIHGGGMAGFVKRLVVGVGFQFGNFPEFRKGLGNL